MDIDTPTPFILRVCNCLRVVLAAIATFFFSLFYVCGKKKIPSIQHDILKQPAIEVARKIRHKEITSVEVVEACIKRIDDVNSILNCLIENRFESAIIEAKEVDALIQSGINSEEQLLREKPLLGVPFTTKDSISVEGLHITAGLYYARHNKAERDAKVIKLLRDKGAIIIGTTNVSELCTWWESHNAIYGRTNNPYDTSKIVGGSSGGEGAIQTVGGSCFGIGSDIGGSIRMPAVFNGIFGHKPSRKMVSNDGNFPEVKVDSAEDLCLGLGPMTRFAVDLKPILQIISGENSDKLKLDQTVNIEKIKIYYQINSKAPLTDPVKPEIATALKHVLDYFSNKYNIKAFETNIKLLKQSGPIWFASIASGHTIRSYILKNGTCDLILEIFKCMFGCSKNTMAILLAALTEDVDISSKKYKEDRLLADELENMFKQMLGDDGVFLFPTHPTPALYHNEPLFRPFNFLYTAIFNSLGFPITAIPLGLNKEGLPIGIQVVANHNNDRLCLAVAEELEKAFGGWVEPQNN